MDNHSKRILTSILLVPPLIFIIWAGKGLPFNLLIITAIFLCMREFYQLMETGGISCFKLSGTLLGIGLGLVFTLKKPGFILCALTLSSLLMFLKTLTSSFALSEAIPSLMGTLLGVFYIPWMMGFLILIRGLRGGKFLIFYLLAIIWADDILAYYTGCWLGKHLLCPKISPKKTVEGMAGGLIGSILAAVLLGSAWLPEASLSSCLLLGLALGSFGQLGDLCESILKRWAGAKESGSVLPGHGGLLDRIDALIFCAPFFYYYATILLHRV